MPLDSYTGAYVPPPVREKMQVLVSRESNFSSLLIGEIVRIKAGGKSVDIAAWAPNGGSMRLDLYYNCMHVSDPRVKEKPDLIDGDPQRGVWDVGPAEKDRQYMAKRIQELQERCVGLEVMIQTLQRPQPPVRPPMQAAPAGIVPLPKPSDNGQPVQAGRRGRPRNR